jgi:hypothetical protein
MALPKWKWAIRVFLFASVAVSLLAVGQTKPVLVVNTPAQPVPTAAQGTTDVAGTINVGNTPNVNVTNSPNVNVANTPTVSLAAGSSINVTNPINGQNNLSPLAVLEAVQPYEDGCAAPFNGLFRAECSFQTIPSGKRLVIEEFDTIGGLTTGVQPVSITLQGANLDHYFAAALMGTSNGNDWYTGHQQTRLYKAPGETPKCVVIVSSIVNSTWFCQLSGFLVDVP